MPNGGKKFSDKSDEKSVDKNEKNEKIPGKGADSAKKKMGEINKAVSKDKRDKFKNEVVNKKKKRRRRRPKKKVFEAVQQPKVEVDDSKLPTPEYEQEREKELGTSDEVSSDDEQFVAEVGGEAESDQQAPINPFEAAEPSASTIEKKALDDKLLDRKNKKTDVSKKVEHEEEETPEETEQSAEQLGEIGAAEEAKAVDMAEVVDVDAEYVVEPVVESATESATESVAESMVESTAEPASGSTEHVEVMKIEDDLGPETEELKKEVWDILEQSGLTKKRIVTFLVIFAVVILFIMFGGLRLFGILGDGDDSEAPSSEGVKIVESDEAGIISSYIFGLEYAEPVGEEGVLGGIEAVLDFGEGESEFESRLVYYVDLLKKMDSIYMTDIYALIDMSVDRRAALQDHIDEMNAIIVEADAVYFEIKSRLESFDAEFEVLAIERDDLEVQFFTATDKLMPRDSHEYLLSFIEVSKEATEIKAYYNAYKMVVDLIIAYLDLLEPRYQDILINTEALVQGIRVFDVPVSDIEAILPIEGE